MKQLQTLVAIFLLEVKWIYISCFQKMDKLPVAGSKVYLFNPCFLDVNLTLGDTNDSMFKAKNDPF